MHSNDDIDSNDENDDIDKLEMKVDECEKTIVNLREEIRELKKTIETIIDNKSVTKRLNCKLIEIFTYNVNRVNSKNIISDLLTKNYENILKTLLFESNTSIPLVKHNKYYIYKNSYDDFAVLQFNELLLMIYNTVEVIINQCITSLKQDYNELEKSEIEYNKRYFFKNKVSILKQILKENV